MRIALLIVSALAAAALIAQTVQLDGNGVIVVSGGQLTRPSLDTNSIPAQSRQPLAGGMFREVSLVETVTNHNFSVTFTNLTTKGFVSSATTNTAITIVIVSIDPLTGARFTNTLALPSPK